MDDQGHLMTTQRPTAYGVQGNDNDPGYPGPTGQMTMSFSHHILCIFRMYSVLYVLTIAGNWGSVRSRWLAQLRAGA